jgi:hypothetical protein
MPAGVDQQSAIIGLWALTALVMGWAFVPALIASLGGTRFHCGESYDAAANEPPASEPDYAYWADQLLELGYEFLGDAWIRIDFAASQWSLYSRVRIFRNPLKHCFAFMQKAPAPHSFWPGAVFATCWADGRLLTTDNNLAADPHPEDEFIRQGTVSLRLEGVEEFHLATMEALYRAGAKPDPELSLETLLHSAQRHLGPEANRRLGREGTQYLFAHGLIHLCVSTAPAYIMGVTHWTVPVANLALALMLWVGDIAQKRQEAQGAREGLRGLRMAGSKSKQEE